MQKAIAGKIYKTKDIEMKKFKYISYGKFSSDDYFIGNVLVNWGNRLQEANLGMDSFSMAFSQFQDNEYLPLNQLDALDRLSKYETYQTFYHTDLDTCSYINDLKSGTYDLYLKSNWDYDTKITIDGNVYSPETRFKFILLKDLKIKKNTEIVINCNDTCSLAIIKHGRPTKLKYKKVEKSTVRKYNGKTECGIFGNRHKANINLVDDFLNKRYNSKFKEVNGFIDNHDYWAFKYRDFNVPKYYDIDYEKMSDFFKVDIIMTRYGTPMDKILFNSILSCFELSLYGYEVSVEKSDNFLNKLLRSQVITKENMIDDKLNLKFFLDKSSKALQGEDLSKEKAPSFTVFHDGKDDNRLDEIIEESQKQEKSIKVNKAVETESSGDKLEEPIIDIISVPGNGILEEDNDALCDKSVTMDEQIIDSETSTVAFEDKESELKKQTEQIEEPKLSNNISSVTEADKLIKNQEMMIEQLKQQRKELEELSKIQKILSEKQLVIAENNKIIEKLKDDIEKLESKQSKEENSSTLNLSNII